MEKIIFINTSPNKEGNTYRIGQDLLKDVKHDVLHLGEYKICQYGVVDDSDEIKEVFGKIKDAETLVIGAPVYWYTIGGILKTFIDRLYMLPESEHLKGKKLYLFAQGSAPDETTKNTIAFLANRVASLMEMELKGVVTSTADGEEIIKKFNII